MFRLTVCCLVLGAALAKPAEKAVGDDHVVSSEEETLHSVRAAIEVGSKSLSDDPQPLPKPTDNSTDLERSVTFYILYPGQYYFTSPNYPSNYPHNHYSVFGFRSNAGQQMRVYCNPFRVEPHSTCSYDFLKLNSYKFCGFGYFTLFGSQFIVEFSTDNTVSYSGFYCLITV